MLTMLLFQGVMRFLQTEWHRHERDRNAWEIERAEMKSRIGRLEGDVRTSKRLHESVGKHVRLLEVALKKEREKVQKLSKDEKVDDARDPKDIARESMTALKCRGSYPFLLPIFFFFFFFGQSLLTIDILFSSSSTTQGWYGCRVRYRIRPAK